MIRKTVFIIPGFGHKPTNKAYKEIAKILKKEGYFSIPVTIPWRQTTISENTEYFLQKLKKINKFVSNEINREKTYILGFSLGAMIAFIASTKVKTAGLILCSLSPYFKEDLSKVNNRRISSLMAQRHQDFSQLHCATLAKQIKAKQIHLLYGAKEAASLKKRVTDVFDLIPSTRKYLVPIKKTEHDVGNKRYLNTIHQIARELN